jgi:hypothetical protein
METNITQALTLAENLTLPRNTVTHVLGVLAMRGMGKSYLASVLMEEMVRQGLFVGFIDPLGIAWGIRSSADGQDPGLNVFIFGGRHGDMQIDPAAGRLVAQAVLDLRLPFVLDLSLFDTEEDQRAFVADFVEAFRPCEQVLLHLIVDEADIFAPQTPQSAESQRSLRAMHALARRYRYKGIGATFICQRPAELHKGVMQFDLLLALCITQPHDVNALDAWIKNNATAEDRATFLSTLASLPVGTAWAWSPRWLHLFERVAIRTRRTYDSSRTPDVDSVPVEPKRLADIDLGALSAQIEALMQRAKETDPVVLQRRIQALEERLRTASARGAARQADGMQIGYPLAEEERARLQARIQELETQVAELSKALEMQRGQPAITAPAVLQMPERLEIGQAVVHQVVASGATQTPNVVEAVPAPPQALPSADPFPAEPQLKLLRTRLARLDGIQQRVLQVLASQEGKKMDVAEIASWLYLQPSTIPSLKPLKDLGVLEVSKGTRGRHLYASRLRQHLRDRFPRLDAEHLAQHLLARLPGRP